MAWSSAGPGPQASPKPPLPTPNPHPAWQRGTDHVGRIVWKREFKVTLTLIGVIAQATSFGTSPTAPPPSPAGDQEEPEAGPPGSEDLKEILPQSRTREGSKRTLSPRVGPKVGGGALGPRYCPWVLPWVSF